MQLRLRTTTLKSKSLGTLIGGYWILISESAVEVTDLSGSLKAKYAGRLGKDRCSGLNCANYDTVHICMNTSDTLNSVHELLHSSFVHSRPSLQLNNIEKVIARVTRKWSRKVL